MSEIHSVATLNHVDMGGFKCVYMAIRNKPANIINNTSIIDILIQLSIIMSTAIESPVEICQIDNPTASVIWLHGLGADGHDFAPVVEMLNLPNIRFVLPHAPYQKITMNNGYEMRAWYDLFGLNSSHPQDEVGIESSRAYVESLIAKENQRGIANSNIVLAGFSQGGAVALHTAMCQKQALAGVLALSTYLPLQDKLATQKSTQSLSTPIFMAHGSFDEVITLERCRQSISVLQENAYQIEWHEYAMAHSVHPQEINDIRLFLQTVLIG
jgi:phospholipase/carboxylesterase